MLSAKTKESSLSTSFWNKVYQNKLDTWTNVQADDALLKHLDAITGGKEKLDFLVPMCGKSQVLQSLAERGHHVVGIEWSEVAVEQFYNGSGLCYEKRTHKIGEVDVPVFVAKEANITVYCGDFFLFEQDSLGGFDCVYDHGAIGCFECSKEKRILYAKIISSFVRPRGRVLLSTFDYIHSEHPSVPYSVTEEEIVAFYRDFFEPPVLLQEFDAEIAAEHFRLREGAQHFPVWDLSRFSWKVLLLVRL